MRISSKRGFAMPEPIPPKPEEIPDIAVKTPTSVDTLDCANTATPRIVESPLAAGGAIDAYQLIQLVGQGGMGEVWLAEQKNPVRRRVALKLIKAGMDTREVTARFAVERQAL